MVHPKTEYYAAVCSKEQENSLLLRYDLHDILLSKKEKRKKKMCRVCNHLCTNKRSYKNLMKYYYSRRDKRVKDRVESRLKIYIP